MCDVSSINKISDCSLEDPGFDSRLGHGVEYLGDLLSPQRPWAGMSSCWSPRWMKSHSVEMLPG